MADIKTLAKTRDVDFVDTFTKTLDVLASMLSTCEPIPAVAGETLHVKKITGSLSTEKYVEGQDIPLSKYTWEDVATIEVELVPFRKQATLQEIKKRGYEAAVDKTDAEMLGDVQDMVKSNFMNVFSNATDALTVTGANFAQAAAKMWGTLKNEAEKYHFGMGKVVYFANPIDFAECIGGSEVFSAFGISFIENWAGFGTLVSTASVPMGTIYATLDKNVKVYATNAEGDDVFGFYTDESGYIAIQHAPAITSLAYDTICYTGTTFFAEYTNFIVKGTIAATV